MALVITVVYVTKLILKVKFVVRCIDKTKCVVKLPLKSSLQQKLLYPFQ